MAQMIGERLGKYRIVERIGRGGMGTVYRAVDETLDREVAVKVINPELVDDDQARRFRAEAVMLARVNHPNIATVHDLILEGGQLLMVMELVRGQTFEHVIDMSAPIRVERAAALMGQVLDALDHAHNAGIVHRDLKPANLMLTPNGAVKVMDFGIARASGSARLTSDGVMIGTPAYMPPEQVRGEEVDGRADLYAAGVVLYRMLTGKLPFKAPTAVAMIQSQLSDTPTPARQLRADLPDWLEQVLTRALAKKPADRFQTAADFRRALGESRSSIDPTAPTIPVAPPSGPARAPTPATAISPLHPSAPVVAAPTPSGTTTVVLNRSHLAMGGVVALLLAVGVGVAVWIALKPQPPPNTTDTAAASRPASAATTTVPGPSLLPREPIRAPEPPVNKQAARSPSAEEALAATAAARNAAEAKASASTMPPPPTAPTPPGAAVPPVPGMPPLPPGMMRGRAGRGSDLGRPPVDPGGVVEIPNVRAYLGMPGRPARFVPTTMQFGDKAVAMVDGRRGGAGRSVNYNAIKRATVSRGKVPKGPGGADVPLRGGGVDLSMPRVWLAIETDGGPMLFWIDQVSVRPIANLLRQRANITVEMIGPE